MARKKTARSRTDLTERKSSKRKTASDSLKKAAAPQNQPDASGLVPVVGVGASAGGLEAFKELLNALPADTGMAYVLVSHLSQAHKSMLVELLSRETPMPVSQVIGRTRVRANHVYLIAPNSCLLLSDGYLTRKKLNPSERPPMVINTFLRSLAEHRKRSAIGVVLSGTGTDGTEGLAAVRAEGGFTFVQDEESARYPDMPRSAAAAAGAADFSLAPAKIAEQIVRLSRQPHVAGSTAPLESLSDKELAPIFQLMKARQRIDFSQYKRPTILRRVSRRMALHQDGSLGDYVRRLRSDAAEVEALANDLLIGVTSFFRDAASFQVLSDRILPELVKASKGDTPVRVWSPACATGEEAYSLAICLLEVSDRLNLHPPIQVFATDVSKSAIDFAREGVYRSSALEAIGPARLKKFFVKTDRGYRVSKQLRELCVFAVQNLLQDPPFSRLDLISCRNLLIYLSPQLQKKLLSTFNYALKPTGYLFLGTSETVGSAAGPYFEQVDKKHRIYRKSALESVPVLREGGEEPPAVRPEVLEPEYAQTAPADFRRNADAVVLNRYAPPGVIVNGNFEIVQFRGKTGPYLEPAPGQASLSLLKMVRQDLLVEMRAALRQAKKTLATVRREGVWIRSEGERHQVDIEVVPLTAQSAAGAYYLVVFDRSPGAPVSATKTTTGSRASRGSKQSGLAVAEQRIADLKAELAATQRDFQEIIKEQEATNEELQSANEESLSSNEELQSTNEELETAKEELQAINEELTTVNDELERRNSDLAHANNDLNNLLSSVDVVYLMVDSELRIRRFTPVAQKIFNLIPSDVGRPISDIRLSVSIPKLTDQIRQVIKTVEPIDKTVQDADGRWYAVRIRPYVTEDNRIDGASLTLADIDQQRRDRNALRESVRHWKSVVKSSPDFVPAPSPAGHIVFLNPEMIDLASKQPPRESIYEFLSPAEREAAKKCLKQVLASGKPGSFRAASLALGRSRKPAVTRVQAITSNSKILALTIRTRRESPGSEGAD